MKSSLKNQEKLVKRYLKRAVNLNCSTIVKFLITGTVVLSGATFAMNDKHFTEVIKEIILGDKDLQIKYEEFKNGKLGDDTIFINGIKAEVLKQGGLLITDKDFGIDEISLEGLTIIRDKNENIVNFSRDGKLSFTLEKNNDDNYLLKHDGHFYIISKDGKLISTDKPATPGGEVPEMGIDREWSLNNNTLEMDFERFNEMIASGELFEDNGKYFWIVDQDNKIAQQVILDSKLGDLSNSILPEIGVDKKWELHDDTLEMDFERFNEMIANGDLFEDNGRYFWITDQDNKIAQQVIVDSKLGDLNNSILPEIGIDKKWELHDDALALGFERYYDLIASGELYEDNGRYYWILDKVNKVAQQVVLDLEMGDLNSGLLPEMGVEKEWSLYEENMELEFERYYDLISSDSVYEADGKYYWILDKDNKVAQEIVLNSKLENLEDSILPEIGIAKEWDILETVSTVNFGEFNELLAKGLLHEKDGKYYMITDADNKVAQEVKGESDLGNLGDSILPEIGIAKEWDILETVNTVNFGEFNELLAKGLLHEKDGKYYMITDADNKVAQEVKGESDLGDLGDSILPEIGIAKEWDIMATVNTVNFGEFNELLAKGLLHEKNGKYYMITDADNKVAQEVKGETDLGNLGDSILPEIGIAKEWDIMATVNTVNFGEFNELLAKGLLHEKDGKYYMITDADNKVAQEVKGESDLGNLGDSILPEIGIAKEWDRVASHVVSFHKFEELRDAGLLYEKDGKYYAYDSTDKRYWEIDFDKTVHDGTGNDNGVVTPLPEYQTVVVKMKGENVTIKYKLDANNNVEKDIELNGVKAELLNNSTIRFNDKAATHLGINNNVIDMNGVTITKNSSTKYTFSKAGKSNVVVERLVQGNKTTPYEYKLTTGGKTYSIIAVDKNSSMSGIGNMYSWPDIIVNNGTLNYLGFYNTSTLINNGIINANSRDMAMHSAVDSTLVNNGTIKNISGSYGVQGMTVWNGGKAINNGNIILSTDGYGMKLGDQADWNTNSTLEGINRGKISITGDDSYGIFAEYYETVNIENSGTIEVTGKNSWGIYSNGSAKVTNTKTGVINVGANAAGAVYLAGGTFDNYGTINISRYNPKGEGAAFQGNGYFNNYGTINANSTFTLNSSENGVFRFATSEDGNYGKVSADKVILGGKIEIGADIAKNSYKSEYILKDVVKGEEGIQFESDYRLSSSSLLYDAELFVTSETGADARLVRNDKTISDFTTGYLKSTADILGKYHNETSFASLSDDAKKIINSIDTENEFSIAKSLNALTPTIFSNIARQIFDTGVLFNNAGKSVIDSLGNSMYGFTALVSGSKVSSKSDIEGYETDIAGFVGATNFGDGIYGTLGYAYDKVDFDGNSKEKISSLHLGAKKLGEVRDFDYSLEVSGEYSFIDSERKISTLGRKAEADFNSYRVGVSGDLSKTYDLVSDLKVKPFALISLAYGSYDDIKELKAGAASAEIKGENYTSVKPKVGAKLEKEIKGIKLYASVDYSYELGDMDKTQSYSLKDFDGKASLPSDKLESGATTVKIGADYNINNFNFNINAGKEYGRRDNSFIGAGIGYKF